MLGSATLTTLPSSGAMNVPSMTAASAHHLYRALPRSCVAADRIVIAGLFPVRHTDSRSALRKALWEALLAEQDRLVAR